jgi:type VI secretion system protein ImpF
MADLTPQERLQPSLLDRITDFEPEKKQESRDNRILSLRRLKESVLRDLNWLLNTTNLGLTDELAECPEVSGSVVNFGIPDLAGLTASSIDAPGLARLVRQAILDFEPRILRDTVKVTARIAEDEMSRTTLSLEIEGQLWAIPVPLHLFLKTAVDLETGEFRIAEQAGK